MVIRIFLKSVNLIFDFSLDTTSEFTSTGLQILEVWISAYRPF